MNYKEKFAFKKLPALIVSFLILFSCSKANTGVEPNQNGAKTIVDLFGRLQVSGSQIMDKNGKPVSIHGMSLFWSQWSASFYNEKCVDWLYNDWKCTVVRAAMGIEGGGYLTNPEAEITKVTKVIDAAIKNGIYVVVDWHDHNAQNHLEQAKQFFDIISEKYGEYPNVIYEIFNEPLQVSWSNVVKPYSVEVIKTIRQNDPDNLIIVGNPTWSQDVDVASKDPIKDPNVCYALHFYTSTHKQFLRDKSVTAMNNGVALFISEFGTSEASGDGIIDWAETDLWINFFKTNKISTCNWSAFDKDETSAALKPGANPQGGWTENDLSESGKFNRNLIRTLNKDVFKAIGIEY
jgi:endoglucanase